MSGYRCFETLVQVVTPFCPKAAGIGCSLPRARLGKSGRRGRDGEINGWTDGFRKKVRKVIVVIANT